MLSNVIAGTLKTLFLNLNETLLSVDIHREKYRGLSLSFITLYISKICCLTQVVHSFSSVSHHMELLNIFNHAAHLLWILPKYIHNSEKKKKKKEFECTCSSQNDLCMHLGSKTQVNTGALYASENLLCFSCCFLKNVFHLQNINICQGYFQPTENIPLCILII